MGLLLLSARNHWKKARLARFGRPEYALPMDTPAPFRTLLEYVIIQPNPERELTAAGLHIPEVAQGRKTCIGRVVAVGPGKVSKKGVRIPVDVEVGAIVAYDARSKVDVVEGGITYHAVRDEAIYMEVDQSTADKLEVFNPKIDMWV